MIHVFLYYVINKCFREHDHALVLPSGQLRAFKGVVESVASSEVVLKISEKVMKPL